MANFRVLRNILFISISAIVLSQVITSCSKSTCTISSNNIAKVKSFKGLHTSVKSNKTNSEKNDLTEVKTNQKNKTSAIDHNKINFSDNPIETENNEELNLTASNKNVIVIPKRNILRQIKTFKKTTSKHQVSSTKELNENAKENIIILTVVASIILVIWVIIAISRWEINFCL